MFVCLVRYCLCINGNNSFFYVGVNLTQTCTIDINSIRWYQGRGGRLMQHIGLLSGIQQATCPKGAMTGVSARPLTTAYTLANKTSWTSGTYLALLTNAQNYQNRISCGARNANWVAELLYEVPVTSH
jgi:hypothetical protein